MRLAPCCYCKHGKRMDRSCLRCRRHVGLVQYQGDPKLRVEAKALHRFMKSKDEPERLEA